MTLIDDKKFKFDDAFNHFKNELKQIRTGRANPAIVENIKVDSYGTQTPLQQIANISIPDAKSIVIQPWDKNMIKEIEKSIQNSTLGINPINEGNLIRLPVPPLTEERRLELAKVVSAKIEEARVSVRNVREEIWKEIKEQESQKQISEDDMFKLQKELQKVVEDYNTEIKETGQEKEKEITTF